MLTSVSPLEYSDPCIQSFTCCSKIMLSVSSFRFAVVLEMFECYLTKKLLSFFIVFIFHNGALFLESDASGFGLSWKERRL